MRRILIPAILLFFALSGCRNKELKQVSEKTIYVEHKIRGEEGAEFVTVLLQFRKGRSGKNELVKAPGSVQLDGQPLQDDSSAIGGSFYEMRLPLESFDGIHAIRFDDGKGNVLTDSFRFKRFKLSELPSIETGKDWEVALPGLQTGDRLMVALTDTAFQTDDIVQSDTVRNGGILLPSSKIGRLKPGPLLLELSFVETRPPAKGAKGSIEVEYSVKRELTKPN
ncbi:MAG: hypothetical protein JWP69_1810 [Flaviaesturariibacter sp.]|nr:hypothetical protein [Flaviaesturariibacter sp.]